MRVIGTLLCVVVVAQGAKADTLTFPSGNEVKGVIMSKTEDAVAVRLRHCLVTLNPSDILSVAKSDPIPEAPSRLLAWEEVFRSLRARAWGPELRPRLAPIIDSGVFKNIPYTRDVSGVWEFSLYGDPDAPVGFEIGLPRALASGAQAKEAAAVLSPLLADPRDREVFASLGLEEKAKAEHDGLVFQVEKGRGPEGTDMWWLTIYNVRLLESARVSDKELPKSEIASEPARAGDTVVASKTPSGKGETQEAISPFGTEADNSQPNPPRRYSRGLGNWGHWWQHHGGGRPRGRK